MNIFQVGLLSVFVIPGLYSFKIEDYHVKWDKQSINSSESMPCGGGDVGLNVWVENDELLFYLSRAGAFDENNVFPKLGRVRVKLNPNPFKDADFSQELNLKEGNITIRGEKQGVSTTMKLWVDVFSPVVHVEVSSSVPQTIEAVYENWRTAPLEWTDPNQTKASLAFRGAPFRATVQPDSIIAESAGILWYHRNRDQSVFDFTVKQQFLDPVKDQLWNPLKSLTFGGYMKGEGLKFSHKTTGSYAGTPYEGWVLKSDGRQKKHRLSIGLHIDQNPDQQAWNKDAKQLLDQNNKQIRMAADKSKKWWSDFWDRSYISINGDHSESDQSWQVGRNYQLFRYQLGCNAFGRYPTKFNGGMFTFDPVYVDQNAPFTPDHRDWGGGTHTSQNQRLVYWPMLKSGDSDIMIPQFEFYLRALKNAELRTKFYWGHNGACFTEQLENFGLPLACSYGWNRPESLDKGVQFNYWLEYEWDTCLEFCKMILQTQQYQAADIRKYMPLIESCLTFFDEHYQYQAKKRGASALNQQGHLVLYPGSGCETYKMAYNSSATVAALKSVVKDLLALPDDYLDADKRTHWEKFEKRIPPIPFREKNGVKTISPAVTWERINNIELPQLYPVFPWGLYGVGLPDLDIAVNTWKYGADNADQKGYVSWHQDAIFCARLGLTEEAKQITVKKLADSPRRYPTFWGPGHDWVPDHNWGGSGMVGLQEMLMQCVDEKIHLFPAWPKEWDVEFKLNAPHNTTVTGSYKNGKIEKLEVTPKSRTKDVVIAL